MIIYATPEQLGSWTGAAAPANAEQVLRSASLLVQGATANSVYATRDDGLPTGERERQALQDATCAQAATWATLGIDPTAGAAGQDLLVPTAKSLGSGSISYAVNTAAQDARTQAATTLCTEAVTILRTAGLLSAAVASW